METKTKKKAEDAVVNRMVRDMGGNKFMAMTGAKPLYKDYKDGRTIVAFKIMRNKSKANYFILKYNHGMDLYEMEFVRVHSGNRTVMVEKEGLYHDMLEPVFVDVTGLNTRL
jgi:hypothetical protein